MSLRPTCSYLKCWNHFGFTEPGTDVLNTLSEQTGRFMWCICGVKRGPCFVSSSINNSDILWYFYLVCSSIFRSYLLPPRCSFWKARSGWTVVVWSDKAAEISTVAEKLGRISTVVVEAAYRCLGWWSDCRCSPAVSSAREVSVEGFGGMELSLLRTIIEINTTVYYSVTSGNTQLITNTLYISKCWYYMTSPKHLTL